MSREMFVLFFFLIFDRCILFFIFDSHLLTLFPFVLFFTATFGDDNLLYLLQAPIDIDEIIHWWSAWLVFCSSSVFSSKTGALLLPVSSRMAVLKMLIPALAKLGTTAKQQSTAFLECQTMLSRAHSFHCVDHAGHH